MEVAIYQDTLLYNSINNQKGFHIFDICTDYSKNKI